MKPNRSNCSRIATKLAMRSIMHGRLLVSLALDADARPQGGARKSPQVKVWYLNGQASSLAADTVWRQHAQERMAWVVRRTQMSCGRDSGLRALTARTPGPRSWRCRDSAQTVERGP